MSLRVLVVDDQRSPRRSLGLLLKNAGMQAGEAASGPEALAELEAGDYDVVVTDLRMDGMSGIDLLRTVKSRYPGLPVILITAYGSIESAVEAMRLGAYDYLTKPFDEDEMLEKIQQAHALAEAGPLERPSAGTDSGLIANSPVMRGVLIRTERIACTELSILITGETGTGKSLLARYIHDRSQRAGKVFVSLNCASLPEQLLESELFGHAKGSFTGASETRKGLFEEADGGTIFLDEIDTLTPAIQAKLLSVLQEREIRRLGTNQPRKVDIRVVTAANRDLSALIETGEFRPDLYYRVNGYHINLPPLRERVEDLEPLLDYFLKKHSARHNRSGLTLSEPALARLLNYSFPGNVRQLETMVEQMVVFAGPTGVIDLDALPEEVLHQGSQSRETSARRAQPLSLAENEQQVIEAALERYDSLTEVARNLGIGRTTLWRKLRQYNIRRGPGGGQHSQG
ncbi:sigma-54-dependent transcriptional regulator [Thiohalobacter thiocyanaticus]|uniref:Sigma-54-dependent Fis family transcriptional regulator n=1 Tax=Thiohalobacter thiocyanaticus TaxID=585455 RepID=A0A426QIU2_9GAMM|nr:sigma-54 dependent transcriptional regulator [Thiohalobacter thiocyanaticus]RRQ21684.1 sigma-54-dependent Fis family transcriptional regulator [Thiohalobacter thiocyanaticus]